MNRAQVRIALKALDEAKKDKRPPLADGVRWSPKLLPKWSKSRKRRK